MTDKKRKEILCLNTKTQSGTPCRRRVPCPYHPKRKDSIAHKQKEPCTKQTVSALRQEKLIQLRLEGKSVNEAALGAGYSPKVAEGKIFKIMETAEFKARIQRHLTDANLAINETIGLLVSHMRGDLADFFPDDDLLQGAKRLGISHLIRKVKRRPVVAGFDQAGKAILAFEVELELHDQQAAAKHLTKVFGQEQLPAPNIKAQRDFDSAVESIMQDAKDAGIVTTREAVVARLKALPEFKTLFEQHTVSDAVQ